jgi:hypothetical protein
MPIKFWINYLNDPSHQMWNLVVALIATPAIVSIDVLFFVKNKLSSIVQLQLIGL